MKVQPPVFPELSQRRTEGSCHSGETQSRAAAPPDGEEPREAVHLVRTAPGCLPREVFWACSTRRGRRGRPGHGGEIMLLAWECLGVLLEELENVAANTSWDTRNKLAENDHFMEKY